MESSRKVRQGTVVSDKMMNTVVVAVNSVRHHRLYKKAIRQTKHFYAHDAENTCRMGDQVLIRETRPLSRLKRWEVVEVVQRGEGDLVPPSAIDSELDQGTSEGER